MVFCSKCGGAVNEGARFCSHCGAAIGTLPQEVAVQNRYRMMFSLSE